MGTVIQICRFVVNCLLATITFVVSIPGMVVTAITGIVGVVSALVSNVYNSCSLIITVLDKAINAVTHLTSWLSSVPYYGIFHDLFALDVLGSVFSSFISLVIGIIGFAVIDFFFAGVVIAVPFFILKSVRSLVSIVSAGFVKP